MKIFGSSEGVKDIDKYCKTVGFIFIGLGILHIFLSGVLSALWGGLLIILGIIALFYRVKSILIVVGVTLISVGLLNIYDSLIYGISGFWLILGLFQIGWGIQELRKYPKTKDNPKTRYSPSAIILIVLLAIRAIGQSLAFFMSGQMPGQTIISISFFIALIFGVLYLIALAGISKRTRWGLIMVIFIASIDLILSIIYELSLPTIIVDVILLVLSINILTRIKKKS